MRKRRVTVEPPEKKASTCPHYWVIDTPSGPTSRGECQRCGEVREFKNFDENDYLIDFDSSGWLDQRWKTMGSDN